MPELLDVTLPTLSETLRSVRRAFTAQYRTLGLSAFKPNNLLFPLSVIHARLQQQTLLLAREQASQATPFGATGANLDKWLSALQVTVPAAATATGTVTITGQNSATLPAGAELAGIDGLVYTTTAPVTFGAFPSSVPVGVTAESTGAAYNREPGDELEIIADSLSASIEPSAVVVSLTGGRDDADDATKEMLLRARLAQSNTAGTVADYRLKALQSDTRFGEVYILEAGKGPGTLSAYPVNKLNDGQASYEVNLPSNAQLTALQSYLDSVRKVNDRPFALLLDLTPYTFNITITPNTADTRAAVTAALGERLAEDYSVAGYTIANSELNAAIGGAAGVSSHVLNNVGGAGPGANIVATVGEFATLGTITFA